MNFTAWVDVAIGLSVVYLGAGLFVTIFNEYLAQVLNSRGKKLASDLGKLIDDPKIKTELQAYPALAPFFKDNGKHAPSYVDPVVLARLLLGSLDPDPKTTDMRERWVNAINTAMPGNSQLKSQLLAVVNVASDTADGLTKAVSEWTDRSLTMLGEGYKQRRQLISLLAGLVISAAFNLDTLALTSRLYQDKEARDAVVEVGVQLTQDTKKAQFEACLALPADQRQADATCKPLLGLATAVTSRNATLGMLPIGWSSGLPTDLPGWGLKVLGCLLTALALSLGAPFWFDLLNRFVSIRHGMRRPDPEPAK